ncbi:DUF6879 family protein [Streptomyces orinoci]|uniref:DUF6879 family protein n=1 Tax=Streptomyces orinoci TaxID=67339 RepID=A0ABV3JQ55_STRON|nr:DUF6879 family protein [Streptomyces orinoci]
MFLDDEEWKAKFQNFQAEAWRLERLPEYRVPQETEEFARFLAGERPAVTYDDDWQRLIRSHTASGRAMGRVHIVTRPLSDYLRFAFQYYAYSVKAGEDVRVLDVTDRENPLPDFQDFWIFDHSTVVLMHFDAEGRPVSRELYEGDPEPFRQAQRIAMAESVPLSEYLKGTASETI